MIIVTQSFSNDYYLESPCAVFGYGLVPDVPKLVISHVFRDTCMIVPINYLHNLRSVSISKVRNGHRAYLNIQCRGNSAPYISCS